MTGCIFSLRRILPLVVALALVPVAARAVPQNGPLDGVADVSARRVAIADPDAQYRLGMKLLKTDVPLATKWFERAALQGHGDAAYQLGRLQSDAKRQVEWYSMAATVGVTAAQYALGEAYLKGLGTAREPAWGVSWFERAARGGDVRAQYALGVGLVTGVLGPVPREEALVWLMVARKNGARNVDLMIDLLSSRMATDAVVSARTRAASWTNDLSSDSRGDAMTRATTRFAQYALGRLGFDAGVPDAIAGKHTEAALLAFRRAENLGDGGLDGRTLDILRERLSILKR